MISAARVTAAACSTSGDPMRHPSSGRRRPPSRPARRARRCPRGPARSGRTAGADRRSPGNALPARPGPRRGRRYGPSPGRARRPPRRVRTTLMSSLMRDRSARLDVIQRSAIRPARSIAARDMPPRMIGGPGPLHRLRSLPPRRDGVEGTVVPAQPAGAGAPQRPEHVQELLGRAPRRAMDAPVSSNSSGSQPMPRPRSSRPPDSTSTVAACLAR